MGQSSSNSINLPISSGINSINDENTSLTRVLSILWNEIFESLDKKYRENVAPLLLQKKVKYLKELHPEIARVVELLDPKILSKWLESKDQTLKALIKRAEGSRKTSVLVKSILSEISKLHYSWKDKINSHINPKSTSRYLFFPNPLKGQKYVISSAPNNSSGDGYHVVGYVALSIAFGKAVPDIRFTYDGRDDVKESSSEINTYTQVKRMEGFFGALGLSGYLKPSLNIKSKSYHHYPRQAATFAALQSKGYTHYIDQKALTTLISFCFNICGFEECTQHLRTRFEAWSTGDARIDKQIKTKVVAEIKKIKEVVEDKPFIIFNCRFSSKANAVQNESLDFVPNLRSYLKNRKCLTWYFILDSRVKTTYPGISEDTMTHIFKLEPEHGKLFHLELLLKLRTLPNLRGVIGNTSGTLDLAGLIGHRVYNMHVWNGEHPYDYQTVRILVQSTFMTVELLKREVGELTIRNALRDSNGHLKAMTLKDVKTYYPKLRKWLDRDYSYRFYLDKSQIHLVNHAMLVCTIELDPNATHGFMKPPQVLPALKDVSNSS